MTLEQLQATVIDALEDIKGQNILVFDAQPLTSLFDRVVIVSGTSNRQTRALAKNLHDKVKEAGGGVYGVEGEDTGEWVLVDLGDIIVHIMQPAIREYYRLEEIWGKHPIDWEAARKKPAVKRKSTVKKPIRGVEPPEKKTTAKVSAKKTPAKAPAAQKTSPKPADAKKSAAKKPAAKKAQPKK